jgi:hypothetical protein
MTENNSKKSVEDIKLFKKQKILIPDNSKKSVEDIRLFKKEKILIPDKKPDRQGMNYTSVYKKNPEKDPGYNWHEYDNIFQFLYKMPMLYTKVLREIDNIHNEYGYLTPIIFQTIAKKLNMPVAIILDIIHTFRRKRIVFLYKHNIIRLHKLLIKKKIINQMEYRHPSIARSKGLGYKQLKPKE